MCLTIHQAWDRPLVVRVGEQHKFLVDEIVVGE